MDAQQYREIEQYMLSCMGASSHDRHHVYRVLYVALDIAQYERDVDYDVLLAACLLHDIGRAEQFADPSLNHADVGADKACEFLLKSGWDEGSAARVRDCIRAHRFRSVSPPQSIEAKILFDADKIDVTGALGIARTLLYEGQVGEPLYTLREDGSISDGSGSDVPSFFREYKFKLEKLYDSFYTAQAKRIAAERRKTAVAFYEGMLAEVQDSYALGLGLLGKHLS